MKGKLCVAIAAALMAVPAAAPAAELSAEAKRVVDYLLQDWSNHMHSTSIPLAMENLGLGGDEGLRLEIGEHFRKNADLANNVKWWGANNYLLSNEEKRIAKQLIGVFQQTERMPSLDESARELGLSGERVAAGMAFMEKAGLLRRSADSPSGFTLIDKYLAWGGPLRYNFHTITIGKEKPFDVW